jgi:hypothetical protein
VTRPASSRLHASYFSSDAARAPEGSERKNQHGCGVYQCETEQPRGRAAVPLAPGGHGSINRKHGEERAGGLMEKLPKRAPHHSQCDFYGIPQHRIEAGWHARILVQNRRTSAAVDFWTCRRGPDLVGADKYFRSQLGPGGPQAQPNFRTQHCSRRAKERPMLERERFVAIYITLKINPHILKYLMDFVLQ